jgi:GNAT superfamily N-acetyltransferase
MGPPVSEYTLSRLRTIEAKTVRASADGRTTERIGPFLACAHETSDVVWLSYAIPLSAEKDGADVADAVARMRPWFAARNRRLRMEILEPLWPELAPQLVACGMTLKERMPIMLCGAGDLRPVAVPAGLTITDLTASASDAELMEAATVARRAFGETAPTPSDVARKRDALEKGWYRDAVARVDSVVGVGSMTVGNDELVGIATDPVHRGRGIAAAISHYLAAEHFARGAELVWLSAGDDGARRVYERIGFGVVGEQANLSDP